MWYIDMALDIVTLYKYGSVLIVVYGYNIRYDNMCVI